MINIIKTPQLFSPSGNPTVFQVESDEANIVYFKVSVIEAISSSVISRLEIYTMPNYSNGSFIDLSRIINNTVKWQINNTQNVLSLAVSKPILKYKVLITEMGLNAGVIEALSSEYEVPTIFTVWNSEFNRFLFNSFLYTDYVITNGLPAKFLTYKANNINVNDYSSEQLYILHDETNKNLAVEVKTYSKTGTLLNTYSELIPNVNANRIFRIQVSPKTLSQTLLVDFTAVDRYTIVIKDGVTIKTETKTYYYKNLSCNLYPQNIFWINELGGVDVYQFFNVDEKNKISRTTINKNEYQFNSGVYSDRNDGILNSSKENVLIKQTSNYVAYTQNINDETSKWLNGLMITEQAFIELNDGTLVPISITDENYTVLKQYKERGSLISTQVSYEVEGGLIPTSVSAYVGGDDNGFGTGEIQTEFIDGQISSP